MIEACGKLLAGRGMEMHAYVLGELVAIFIAGHVADDPAQTPAFRALALDEWLKLVRDLVPEVARERGIDSP